MKKSLGAFNFGLLESWIRRKGHLAWTLSEENESIRGVSVDLIHHADLVTLLP